MQADANLYPRATATREAVSLDGIWNFKIDWAGCGESAHWKDGLKEADWIPVPASFQDFYTDKETREFTGDVWYAREFYVPDTWRGRAAFLRFGCATHRAEVFVNGKRAGGHEGGFLPFCISLDDVVEYGRANTVIVRVNNELSETTLPCGMTKVLADGRRMTKPYFDFFNYAGLQRPVYLIALPQERILDFSVVHTLHGADAAVQYTVQTNGTHPVAVTVYDAAGNQVAAANGSEGVIRIPNVHLWEVRSAYLYRFEISILDGDTLLDTYSEEIGIRTVSVKGEEILLNGKPVYLRGFGKHEDSDIIGRGYHPGVMKRDFECMKWIGANSFRTSHYPYSEEIYQMADREGFLVIDELPAVGMFESLMNFMEASTGKKTAFFEKETTDQLLQAHLSVLEALIQRDKNHACVIAWSLFNEPETTNSAAVPYFEKVFARAWELDPQQRPRTFALIMNSRPETCHCYQFADIISLNRYYGWYVSGGYEIADAEAAFRQELDAWQALKLDKPFLFTEYGADTSAAEHKLPSVMWSQEYQWEYLQMCHRVFDAYPFVKGEQVWNFADFQTTEGIMRMNGNKKGIFTRQRQPKAAAYLYKQRWESLPLNFKSQG